MQTFGFVGPSGTGKSYRATYVASQNQIRYIIDDGLFINSRRILAGFSAKREETKLASVRRALFTEKEHVDEVKAAILKYQPDKILILGTSERMIEKIAKTLDLPPVTKMIHIEEIATPDEMAYAQKVRREQGKHVIPVPTFEVKKDFSGYFIDSLKVFLNYGKTPADGFSADKTVVRPTFSYMGNYHISNHVITTLARFEAGRIPGVARVIRTAVQSSSIGVIIAIDLSVYLTRNVVETARHVQEAVRRSVEEYTSINVINVNIAVRTVEVPDEC